jgi:hypothetical protein
MAALFRFIVLAISKTFSKLFGVATITFFGRMPSKDDDKVAAVGVASLMWVFLPIGIAVPGVAEVLIPFLPDDEAVVRTVAAALTVLVPPVIGFLTTLIENHKAAGRSGVKQVLKGYVYAPTIGVLVIALLVVVAIVKAGRIFQMNEVKHLAIMVRKGDFRAVQDEVTDAFERSGIPVRSVEPNRAVQTVFKYLTWVEANIFLRDMDTAMRILQADVDGEEVEVMLHATDIAMIGRKAPVARTMAILSEELSEEHLYFTWDDAAQRLEDEILDLRHRLDRGEQVAESEVLELRDRLRRLELDSEEWNSLRRHLYALERDCFRFRVESDASRQVT